ncbi:MAG: hypothetical protein ACYSX0_00980 [Planctomycetota bacterium]|jgi:hypothetical protein
MIPILMLAGLSFTVVHTEEPVLDVRVVDLDADGGEDVVAVTAHHLLLYRAGKGPPVRREVPPLTVVGRGLCGVVYKGRYHEVTDPFGRFELGPPGAGSLLAALGRSPPALLDSPGDLDGDGKADAVLATEIGFATPLGPLLLNHEAVLEIDRNETFAVEYKIPLPVIGNWSGGGRELVFFHKDAVVSYLGLERTARIGLPLSTKGKEAAAIRRNHVFLRDVDRDGRLDLLVVMARGSTGLFGAFEANARLFKGGRIYDPERKGFYRPASFIKIAGALLAPDLLDLDGDGDLDLVLSAVNTSIIAAASGTAPGSYLLFRFEKDGFLRRPAWSLNAPVPLSAFQAVPDPPVTFLPDLNGNGRPEAIERGAQIRLLEADASGVFRAVGAANFDATKRPARGRRMAAVAGRDGIGIVTATK